jgi:hypothetical protein
MFFKENKKNKGGFLVLTMVLLVTAVVLLISAGVMLRSIGDINQSSDSENSLKAWSAVTACGEYALGQLASTTGSVGWSYAGDVSSDDLVPPLELGGETCYIYPVEDGNDGAKIVKASSTVSGFTRKILIEVATNAPSIVVNSWDYVADFSF